MRIKIDSADHWFSKCVRISQDMNCERCGKNYAHAPKGLHCSHYYSRKYSGIRFDQRNAFAHCFGCHQLLGASPQLFADWYGEHQSEEIRERVKFLFNNLAAGRRAKREHKDIMYHYRMEAKQLIEMREDGVTGTIPFANWDYDEELGLDPVPRIWHGQA